MSSQSTAREEDASLGMTKNEAKSARIGQVTKGLVHHSESDGKCEVCLSIPPLRMVVLESHHRMVFQSIQVLSFQ